MRHEIKNIRRVSSYDSWVLNLWKRRLRVDSEGGSLCYWVKWVSCCKRCHQCGLQCVSACWVCQRCRLPATSGFVFILSLSKYVMSRECDHEWWLERRLMSLASDQFLSSRSKGAMSQSCDRGFQSSRSRKKWCRFQRPLSLLFYIR